MGITIRTGYAAQKLPVGGAKTYGYDGVSLGLGPVGRPYGFFGIVPYSIGEDDHCLFAVFLFFQYVIAGAYGVGLIAASHTARLCYSLTYGVGIVIKSAYLLVVVGKGEHGQTKRTAVHHAKEGLHGIECLLNGGATHTARIVDGYYHRRGRYLWFGRTI